MCGIIGYVGKKQAQPIVMDGLKRLEYRGYDSAGVAIVQPDGTIGVAKKAGKLSVLGAELAAHPITGTVGIGHTRWATHGGPTDMNAHPHGDCNDEVFVIHNGIIENFRELKKQLEADGHTFKSQTDTEVVAHLIERAYTPDVTLEQAVQVVLGEIVGAYGLCILSSREPEKIVAARLGSPLIVGLLPDNEYMVASGMTALLPYTREVIYMEEHEMAVITPKGYVLTTIDNKEVQRESEHVEWDIAAAEKGGFDHYMLKEMMEQPQVVVDGMRGRLIPEEGIAHLGGFLEYEDRWRDVERIIIVACGSAAIAGQIGEYMIEEYAGIPVEVEIGSEFRYRKPVLNDKTAVIFVSQSGETADTIACLREVKRQGVLTFGIVNVVGSTLAREVDSGAFIHAGPEVSVASTKALMGMMNLFAQLTVALGRSRGMSLVTGKRILEEMEALPKLMTQLLEKREEMMALGKTYAKYDHAFYLGRKYNFPVASEGALKLKELAYVHAEAYPSGELKHGPLALVDDRFFTVVIAPQDSVYEKSVSNIQEVRARGGRVIVIATEGDDSIHEMADDVIFIPKTLEMLTPMLAVIPLQLLAYAIAVERDCDIDQPRNLAKSVTVE